MHSEAKMHSEAERNIDGVRVNKLCIGLLQQSTPELVARLWVHVDELVAGRRQPVIYQHLHPPAVLPELEPKHSCTQHHHDFNG